MTTLPECLRDIAAALRTEAAKMKAYAPIYSAAFTEAAQRVEAALERQGQPFGFTHEDVAFLTKLEMWETMDFEEWRANVVSLRERIAALLPPREGER